MGTDHVVVAALGYSLISVFFLTLATIALCHREKDWVFGPATGWLIVFSASHGLFHFLDYPEGRNDIAWLAEFRDILLFLSLVALMEFGRRLLAGKGGFLLPGVTIYSILFAAGLGLIGMMPVDASAFDVTIRTILGVPGGLLALAGCLLFAFREHSRALRERLLIAAFGLSAAGYGASCLVVPGHEAQYPWVFSGESFRLTVGMPIELFRIAMAFLAVLVFGVLQLRKGEPEGIAEQVMEVLEGFYYRAAADENRMVTSLFGNYRKVLPGETGVPVALNNLVHPGDRERVLARLREAMELKQRYVIEYRLLTEHGSVLLVQDSGRVSGDGRYMEGYIQDVMRQRRVGYATRVLFDSAPVIVLLLDERGDVLEVNSHFENLTGFDRAEVVGRNWLSSFIPDEGKVDVARLFERAIQGVPTNGNVNAVLKADGGEILVEWYDRTVEDDNGAASFLLAIGMDVSARVRSQRELEHSTMLLEEAQRMAQFGNWELDIVNNRLFWSDNIYELTGLRKEEKEEVTYEDFVSALHPDDRERIDAAYQRSLATRSPYNVEHRLLRPDGSIRWVRQSCETFFDEAGSPVRSIGVVQDITETREAQNLVRAYQEHLEQLVEERTAELREARDEAEIASAAKTSLLSRVSHELRTPLNSILGFAQVMESDVDNPLQGSHKSNLAEILESGAELLTKVDRLLQLQALETRDQPAREMDRVSINQVISNAISAIQSTQQTRILAESKLVDVVADPERLEQVLTALIHNAAEYSDDSIAIRIDETEESVRIRIIDKGPGLPEDAVDSIFDYFTRMDSPFLSRGGLGISLALSKRLVESMGGEIGVESTPGHGCTFWVELKRIASQDDCYERVD